MVDTRWRATTFPFFWYPPRIPSSPYSSDMIQVSLSLTPFLNEFEAVSSTPSVACSALAASATAVPLTASSAEDSYPQDSRVALMPSSGTLGPTGLSAPRPPPCGDRYNFIIYGLVIPSPSCKFMFPPSDGAESVPGSREQPRPPESRGTAPGRSPVFVFSNVNLTLAVIRDRPV